MGVAEDVAELRDLAAEYAAWERGPVDNAPRVAATSRQWVRGTHPDHGERVVFKPGTALPDWVVAALPKGRPDPNDERVILL
jgi:hypothetical protein